MQSLKTLVNHPAGATLVPRGEFSIVLAGVAIARGIDSDLGPIIVAYALLLGVGCSVATRFVT
jgi:CPA2 family monovalent cation:H+ antiporter-2